MRWIRCSWLAGLLLVTTSGVAPALDADEAQSLLAVVRRDAGDAAWDDAVARLVDAKDPDLDARLARVLLALRRDAERRHRLASARLDEIAARSTRDAERWARKLEEWDAARAAAREWIFDPTKFPDVDRPVVGPEEGHAEAERRGQAARRAFDALTRALDREGRADDAFFPDRFAVVRDEFEDATRDWKRIAGVGHADGEGSEPPPRPDHALVLTLDAVARDDHRVTADRLAALPAGWERLRVWYAWCRRIQAANEAALPGLSKAGRNAIADLNDYRMALGIPPLRHDAALVKMANTHADEMRTHHYFSHESPVEGRTTSKQRAVLAGYTGRVHECLSLRGSQASAMVTWRYDGGHHRDLLFGVDVGLSERAPWTFNVGEGDPAAIKPPLYAK